MTFWETAAVTLIAALIGGTVSPVLVSLFQHRTIWRSQKVLELKWSVFQDASRALSMLERDAYDLEFQTSKPVGKGSVTQVTATRGETNELLSRSLGMVKAFFSAETSTLYDLAVRTHVGLDNIPNDEFDRNRIAAVTAMARELKILPRTPIVGDYSLR